MRVYCALGLDAGSTAPASIIRHVGLARGLNRELAVIGNQVTRHLAGLAVEKLPCPGLRVREREHRLIPSASRMSSAGPRASKWRLPVELSR